MEICGLRSTGGLLLIRRGLKLIAKDLAVIAALHRLTTRAGLVRQARRPVTRKLAQVASAVVRADADWSGFKGIAT